MRADNVTMFFALLGWLAAFNITVDFLQGFLRGLLGL